MIKILNAADCCGCTACASICTHQAIKMVADPLGFLYPEVDNDRCTNCGLCERVCAFHGNYDTSRNLPLPITLGARHKDLDEIIKSRSGATFAALSDYVLEQGGVVYGAGYADHFRVVHKRATTKTERDGFRGSKYVQSNLSGILVQVKHDLCDGRTVLFSGTPCQVAAVSRFVGERLRENLILVDIVCHGVPSPTVWKDYLSYIEKQEKGQVISVDFRNKKLHGWAKHFETFCFENGKEISRDIYTRLFYKHIMLRPSCGNCHFCNTARPSDITLADFWGWEKTDKTFNEDDRGASLILCNTENGASLFEKTRTQLSVIDVNIEDAMQPNLQHPSVLHPQSEKFAKDFNKKGLEYVLSHLSDYDRDPLIQRIVHKAKAIIKRFRG